MLTPLYWGLLLWQIIWHAWLVGDPSPDRFWLTGLITLPLTLPLAGIMQHRHKAIIWGAYLSIFYFVYAVVELWSEATQRWPAFIQLLLSLGFLLLVMLRGRRRSQE